MTAITLSATNTAQHAKQLHQERADQAMLATMEKTSTVFLGLALILGILLFTGPIGFLLATAVVATAALALCCGSVQGRVYVPDHDHGHRSSGWRMRFPISFPRAPELRINRPVYLPAREQQRGGRFRIDEMRVPVGSRRY